MNEIEMRDLSFSYGDTPVFKDINLVFNKSELICILGPNGVGKTTLVKCINKLLKPTSGTVLIDGKDNKDISLLEMAKIMAYVPNSTSNVFSTSVAEAILMGRHPHAGWTTSDKDVDTVDKAMEIMGLQSLANREIKELSAGQLQRVMIARGLVQEPRILILDEPTSNLDIKHQMKVMGFLKDYAKKEDTMILMVCHDLNITATFADRIVIMSKGGIYADGQVNEVLNERTVKDVYDVECKILDVNGRPHIILLPESDGKEKEEE